MAAPAPTIQLRYGVPGLLVTSGIALLAISIVHARLFTPGIWLLLLGILSFIADRIAVPLENYYGDLHSGEYIDPMTPKVIAPYIIGLVLLAIVVVIIILPLLT